MIRHCKTDSDPGRDPFSPSPVLTLSWNLARSIWTIDLAHLLRRFGMSVVFTTITVGTNPEYADELFYAENMHADETRVQQLFLVRC